jgi:cell wall-associated NlpC family hydrolase
VSTELDPRLNAYRLDLADARLKGHVAAARFVEGTRRRVVASVAPLKRAPRGDASLDSELLRGEVFQVFDDDGEGWSWGQAETDSYVGYVPSGALGELDPAPTHRITALRTFIYAGPDLKLPVLSSLSIGSLIALGDEVETRGAFYRMLASGEGAVSAAHARPVDAPPDRDFVAVAERFLNTPYLWGGRSGLGVDCSSLVQLSLMMAGRSAPRDTDLQETAIGRIVEHGIDGGLIRGDLVFWKGHAAILLDGWHIIHASGHHMAVVVESLADAVTRITPKSGAPTAVKRIEPPSAATIRPHAGTAPMD